MQKSLFDLERPIEAPSHLPKERKWSDDLRIVHGPLQVVWTSDGRTLLWLKSVGGGAWLELMPDDQNWLAEYIKNGREHE
jgi:hypothetical protein